MSSLSKGDKSVDCVLNEKSEASSWGASLDPKGQSLPPMHTTLEVVVPSTSSVKEFTDLGYGVEAYGWFSEYRRLNETHVASEGGTLPFNSGGCLNNVISGKV